jgi:GNAT superfamily N-acetyltransferase
MAGLEDAAINHCSWFGRGREHHRVGGISLYLGPHDATLAFPPAGADPRTAVELAVGAGVREIGCWALRPDAALGARLTELGFQDGWQPHWMGLEPAAAGASAPPHQVEATAACAPDLPYRHERPPGGRHFVVRGEGRIVGHAIVALADGTAGLYDMGVLPTWRRRGVGRSLALACIDHARGAACRSLTLNATGEGEPLYRSVGFRSLGLGMTWWRFPGCG